MSYANALRRTFRPQRLAPLALLLGGLAGAAPAAHAYPVHVVTPGETLSGIAAANGMQVARLAAANGLSWDAVVIAGQSLQVPPADGLYTSTSGQTMGYATSTTPQTANTAGVVKTNTGTTVQTTSAVAQSGAASSGAAHTVSPGESLSVIAARLGVSIAALAAANGISDPNFVMAGITLKAPAPGTTTSPAPSMVPVVSKTTSTTGATGPEGAAAYAGAGAGTTAERLSGDTIGSIAAQHGVPGNLAKAIAWQESGWNNGLTSSTGAKGIMQVMPGTWDWINSTLARPPLQSHSATENVRAGSLLLKSLLQATGGNEAMAIAGYYQGLSSVRSRGMYDDTKQYVNNVLSIKSRFGG
ncbi:MAG: LysM peptidoglycan-binding domain-containing protein [Solirubrobacteraceae bacterium]|nr:LysM peptidoglycan-binding domain-containing protein [Solirubrobacteraceae bacterium]